ncbi:E3 ubiquitin ligase family protein [bacterium]|nr:E3 ubiquitin ligase family protein [bacterium]NUN44047.1 hypothetical protein [bacterium]
MEGIIIGLVCFGIAALLLYFRKKNQDKLLEIKFVKTSTAQELKEICKQVNDELSTTGAFRQQTEVKGVIKCAHPITSELAKQPCVWYEMSVDERYEETYTERDQNGREVRRTRTGTENVASNSQRVHFEVEDATGRITINPNDADIEGTQVLNRYEQNFSGGRIQLGAFSMNINMGRSGRRILGYEFTESLIPLDRRVYVLGEASDASGELMVQKPEDKEKPFIITLKSEEELTRGTESTIRNLMIGSIVLVVIGLVAITYGIMK